MTGRVITYIDGFNLYFGLREAGYQRYYWLDLVALSRHLLKPGQSLVQTRYFTSRVKPVAHDPGKIHRQAAYLDALGTLPNLLISYGHYLSKPMTCKKCGATWERQEEKMTDVNIACALLEDAYRDRFDTALVLSGDSDLTPPIRLIRSAFPAKRVIVVFPPHRHSNDLRSAAHGSFQLGRANLHASQLPDRIALPNGHVIQRPTEWR
jgi:hypothetical protein